MQKLKLLECFAVLKRHIFVGTRKKTKQCFRLARLFDAVTAKRGLFKTVLVRRSYASLIVSPAILGISPVIFECALVTAVKHAATKAHKSIAIIDITVNVFTVFSNSKIIIPDKFTRLINIIVQKFCKALSHKAPRIHGFVKSVGVRAEFK